MEISLERSIMGPRKSAYWIETRAMDLLGLHLSVDRLFWNPTDSHKILGSRKLVKNPSKRPNLD